MAKKKIAVLGLSLLFLVSALTGLGLGVNRPASAADTLEIAGVSGYEASGDRNDTTAIVNFSGTGAGAEGDDLTDVASVMDNILVNNASLSAIQSAGQLKSVTRGPGFSVKIVVNSQVHTFLMTLKAGLTLDGFTLAADAVYEKAADNSFSLRREEPAAAKVLYIGSQAFYYSSLPTPEVAKAFFLVFNKPGTDTETDLVDMRTRILYSDGQGSEQPVYDLYRNGGYFNGEVQFGMMQYVVYMPSAYQVAGATLTVPAGLSLADGVKTAAEQIFTFDGNKWTETTEPPKPAEEVTVTKIQSIGEDGDYWRVKVFFSDPGENADTEGKALYKLRREVKLNGALGIPEGDADSIVNSIYFDEVEGVATGNLNLYFKGYKQGEMNTLELPGGLNFAGGKVMTEPAVFYNQSGNLWYEKQSDALPPTATSAVEGGTSEYDGEMYRQLLITFDWTGSNGAALYSSLFPWLHRVTLNGERINAESYADLDAAGSGVKYYGSSYFDSQNMRVLKCFFPESLRSGGIDELVLPAGLRLDNEKDTKEKTFYGYRGGWYNTREEAENAKANILGVTTKNIYELNRDGDQIHDSDAYMVVGIRFDRAGANDISSDATALSVLRAGVLFNGKPLTGNLVNSCYFEDSDSQILKFWLPYSNCNFDGYDTLYVPGGYTLSGGYVEEGKTFYGRAGVWQESAEGLPQWNFATLDKLYDPGIPRNADDGTVMRDIEIYFTTPGNNSVHESILTLWFLQRNMTLNGEKMYKTGNGFYFDDNNLYRFFARTADSLRRSDGTPDELYLPGPFMVGDKIFPGGVTYYGRYGVWSEDASELPAVTETGKVCEVVEQGQEEGFFRLVKLKFDISAAASDGQANVDVPGYALYELRRGIRINGNPIREEVMNSAYFNPEAEYNWQWFVVWLHQSDRNSSGYDELYIPGGLWMKDGKRTGEGQTLYFYEDAWHLEKPALKPSFTELAGDEFLEGSILFNRPAAETGDEFSAGETALKFNGKTVAELNAVETVVTLEWVSATELKYTIAKSALSDGKLNLKIEKGFVFPNGESLGTETLLYYDFGEAFWLKNSSPIEKEVWEGVLPDSVEKPVAQAGGAYMIAVNFKSNLVSPENSYLRLANVVLPANTLLARTQAHVPGYYYDAEILEFMIRFGVRDSVLDGIRLNGKSLREMMAEETSEALAKDCLQVDFRGSQLLIFVTGESKFKITDPEGMELELLKNLSFQSGKWLNADSKYVYRSGKWRTEDSEEPTPDPDKTAAEAVVALIDAIPADITLSDKSKVTAARAAYDALTAAQKELVPSAKLNKLTSAETALRALESPDEPEGGCGGCGKGGSSALLSVLLLLGGLAFVGKIR